MTGFESQHVNQVLWASGGSLIGNQVLSRQNLNWDAIDRGLHAASPCGSKADAGNRRQDVDPQRSDADLKNNPFGREVFKRQIEQRSSEVPQRGDDPFRIRRRTIDPQIEIASGSSVTVRREGVRSDNEIPNAPGVERRQHVFEVGFQQCPLLRRPMRSDARSLKPRCVRQESMRQGRCRCLDPQGATYERLDDSHSAIWVSWSRLFLAWGTCRVLHQWQRSLESPACMRLVA